MKSSISTEEVRAIAERQRAAKRARIAAAIANAPKVQPDPFLSSGSELELR